MSVFITSLEVKFFFGISLKTNIYDSGILCELMEDYQHPPELNGSAQLSASGVSLPRPLKQAGSVIVSSMLRSR